MTKPRRPSPNSAANALFDEMLVVMAQGGDTRALGRLYQRWNPKLLRAARRYCSATADDTARDLAQESWVGICKGLRSLREARNFRSFAFAVLHRKGADHLRRVVKDRENLSDAQHDTPQSATQSDSASIAQAFAKLPPDQRLAAHLHFVEGLTLPEIAHVQSIPEGTAKSRLFHARRKLKAALSPDS